MGTIDRHAKLEPLFHRKGLFLMLAQFVVLLLYPSISRGLLGGIFAYGSMAVVLLAAVQATSETPRSFRIALALGIPSFVLIVLTALDLWLRFMPNEALLPILTNTLVAAFFIYTLVRVFLSILRARKITGDVLCGAVAVYLLMGFAWASLYGLMERLSPGCLQIAANPDVVIPRWWILLYFSFVTLCSLGYGDIIPVTDFARSMAVVESVIGVMYVAIIVATLAGLYTREARERED